MNSNVARFLPFYKRFYKTVQGQQLGSDKLPVVSFIELPSCADVLFLRKFVNYFNRSNKKSIDIAYGKRGVRDIFFEKKYNRLAGSLLSSSSSRGVVVYAKDYKIFCLLLDFMSRSSLNYVMKDALCFNVQKFSSFAELIISLNPEKLFTTCSLKKYKLLMFTRFFVGGFLISAMLKHIFNK
jgi:hypothetical protein